MLTDLAQLLLDTLRVARAPLSVSTAIVYGMLAGIGAVIALGRLDVVLGGCSRSSALDNLAPCRVG